VRRVFYALIAATILVFAVGLPAYLVFGQPGGGYIVTVTVTATPLVEAPTPPPPGGGGGGGGEGGCPAGEVSAADRTTYTGVITRTIVVKSTDDLFELTIDKGTTARTSAGLPLGCIGIHEAGSPVPPEDVRVIGTMYYAVPDRATFSPPATIRYSYDPTAIPEGVSENRLVIACYDKVSDKWIVLDSVVDTQTKTIAARISRFNDLAVFGYRVEAPPPAAFQISSLGISPTKVYIGEPVNISPLVANIGGHSGSYQVILQINGVAEASQEVVLEAGASTEVSFTISKIAVGTYSVDVNGVTGTFEVKLRPKPFPWWLIAQIISALTLASLLTHLFWMQKKHGGVRGVMAIEVGKAFSLVPKLGSKTAAAVRSLFKKSKVRRGKR